MTYRSFKTLEEIWRFKAESASNTPGMSQYAYAKSDVFGRLASDAKVTCMPYIKVRDFSEFNAYLYNCLVPKGQYSLAEMVRGLAVT
jgi:hypothetical protein